jgi:hypothetical protein
MQFQVPQFIEVEDKIFGPLTFRQFIYIAGGLGGAYILWRVLPPYIGGPIALAICGFAGCLAFLQFNGRPFIVSLESGFYYFTRSKLYLWSNAPKKKNVVVPTNTTLAGAQANLYVPKLSESKLHELSWSLDIKERIAQGIASDVEREGTHPEAPLSLTQTPQQVRNRILQEAS